MGRWWAPRRHPAVQQRRPREDEAARKRGTSEERRAAFFHIDVEEEQNNGQRAAAMRALALASLAARAAGYANVIASQAAASQTVSLTRTYARLRSHPNNSNAPTQPRPHDPKPTGPIMV